MIRWHTTNIDSVNVRRIKCIIQHIGLPAVWQQAEIIWLHFIGQDEDMHATLHASCNITTQHKEFILLSFDKTDYETCRCNLNGNIFLWQSQLLYSCHIKLSQLRTFGTIL